MKQIFREEINDILFFNEELEIQMILFNGYLKFKLKKLEDYETIHAKFEALMQSKWVNLKYSLVLIYILFRPYFIKIKICLW